jgi:hypothetical protein
MTFVLRYIPDSPYGKRFPTTRLPWRRTIPTLEAAEELRQACASTDQLEIVTAQPDRQGPPA